MKNTKLSSLSLFFPAYNEAGNIEEAILQAQGILPKVAEKYEIIVIDDGSSDATLQISKRLAGKDKKIKVVSQENLGYGGALKRGFAEAKYDWIFFTDSDLQFDLDELKKFVKHAKTQDAVIGYRTNRAEGPRRELLAKALLVWNIILLGFPKHIKDIDCAFKLIRRSCIKQIEPLFSNGAMISSELIIKLYKSDFKIKQLGVKHYNRAHGSPTGSNLKVIFKAIVDTFILRFKLAIFDTSRSLRYAQDLLLTRVK